MAGYDPPVRTRCRGAASGAGEKGGVYDPSARGGGTLRGTLRTQRQRA